jgi:hypothetical protein
MDGPETRGPPHPRRTLDDPSHGPLIQSMLNLTVVYVLINGRDIRAGS